MIVMNKKTTKYKINNISILGQKVPVETVYVIYNTPIKYIRSFKNNYILFNY